MSLSFRRTMWEALSISCPWLIPMNGLGSTFRIHKRLRIMLFTYTLFFPHEYMVFPGSEISYSQISADWKRKVGYNEGKQLYNHKNSSKIYYEHYNNYGLISLPTHTKCNLNPIQTKHSKYCTTQPSASYDLIFLSFLQHYNYVL